MARNRVEAVFSQVSRHRRGGGVALSPWQVRTLFALLALYRERGRATVRGVADRLGVRVDAAYQSLQALRRWGLVAFEDGKCGTLRPLVRFVPADRLGEGLA